MWTGHGKRPHGSSHCSNKAEGERDFAKTGKESEKVRLVSQENTSNIKIADEARNIIDPTSFLSS
jgi:hypothetical protein